MKGFIELEIMRSDSEVMDTSTINIHNIEVVINKEDESYTSINVVAGGIRTKESYESILAKIKEAQ